MFNLKKDQKFNITYFAKKYGKYITRSGQWTEQSKNVLVEIIINYLFIMI